MEKKQIHFGVMLNGPGGHMNAWRSSDIPDDASTDFNHYLKVTKKAESAGFAFVFIADGLYINEHAFPHYLNRLEPITILSALAPLTAHIGLIATISTSYSEPYTVARQLASIDKISRGRAGWNVVTSSIKNTSDNYSRLTHPDRDTVYPLAEEHLKAVKGLWHSWENDAFIRDRENNIYFDRKKMHTLNFEGDFFQVKGPLNINRSEQGHPIIFQASASERGAAFAAKHADAVFVSAPSLEEGKTIYKNIKENAVCAGRNKENIKIFPALTPIIGETNQQVQERYHELKHLMTPSQAVDYLNRYFNKSNFSQYDSSFGDIGRTGFKSMDELKRYADSHHLSFDALILEEATRVTPFTGTYQEVAETIIKWMDESAADGFILIPHVFGSMFDEFIEQVIPILIDKGRFTTDYPGLTLRDTLSLPVQ